MSHLRGEQACISGSRNSTCLEGPAAAVAASATVSRALGPRFACCVGDLFVNRLGVRHVAALQRVCVCVCVCVWLNLQLLLVEWGRFLLPWGQSGVLCTHLGQLGFQRWPSRVAGDLGGCGRHHTGDRPHVAVAGWPLLQGFTCFPQGCLLCALGLAPFPRGGPSPLWDARTAHQSLRCPSPCSLRGVLMSRL